MLNVGLIGIGGMGRGHLGNLVRFTAEAEIINLVAVCDVNPERFKNADLNFNIKDVGTGAYDFNKFHCYTDMDEMTDKEKLDLVVIALPTYLHCEATVKCLKKGINVFCEKPMALNVEQCQLMIDTAKEMGKNLMIGQCLRFWGEYEMLKKYISEGTLGKVTAAYFYRGGGPPLWSFENWLLKRECGGGALHDQHVHDVDTIHHIFGMPKAVTALGKTAYPGSGYDAVSTNYIFDDCTVINAQDDWTLEGKDFVMEYRVSFEKGSMTMDSKGFKVTAHDGTDLTPDYDKENAYYKELKYYADCIINKKPNLINPPEDSRDTIKIVVAETKSADGKGAVTNV